MIRQEFPGLEVRGGPRARLGRTETRMQATAATRAPETREIRLADDVLVSRTEGIQAARRGSRVLLVEAETASWTILDQDTWPVYALLARPRTFGALSAALPALDPSRLASVVGELHAQGMVRLNGRPFHDVARLWPEKGALGPQFLALHMAQGCNFRCSYCYNSSEMFRGRTMPIPVARRILEKAFQEIPAPSLTFDFMGGEPMLAFESILEVLRYGRELEQRHQKRAAFLMQTNGALLTEERVRVLLEHQVGVGVSLDGPEELHDRHRLSAGGQGTHSQVEANLLRARDLGLQVTPLAVIDQPENYGRVLDYFVELGFEAMRFNYSNYMGRAKENLSFVPERAEAFHHGFMAMVVQALAHARRLGRPLILNDLCFMIRNVDTKRRDYMCMRSPCGLGDSILSFSVDGNVYACEEYEENTKGRFLLGRLEELDLGDLMALSETLRGLKQRRVENIPRCSRCHLRNVCGGGCTHKALAWFGELLREDPMCRFYELTYTELMWKIWDEPDLVPLLGGYGHAPAQ